MKRILLADDHQFIRLGLIQILKDEYPFVEIREVSDTESLINQVIHGGWDLAISDLDMPGRSGLQALEQIKIMSPLLPVLILSYFAEDLYGVRVLKAGASGYMNKNTAPYELITAVKCILSGKKYFASGIAEKLLDNPDGLKKSHDILNGVEFQVFTLLAIGKTNSQIADSLSLAVTNVGRYRSKILQKLCLSTNSELTLYAIKHHIISNLYS
jgi:DNA-binding NarL/FixJ family response regulator